MSTGGKAPVADSIDLSTLAMHHPSTPSANYRPVLTAHNPTRWILSHPVELNAGPDPIY